MERFKADALLYIYNGLLGCKAVNKNDVIDKFRKEVIESIEKMRKVYEWHI